MLIRITSTSQRCRKPGSSNISIRLPSTSPNTKDGVHHPQALLVAVRQQGRAELREAAAAAGARRFPRSHPKVRRGGSSSG